MINMSTLSPKNEMIQLVQQCISEKNFSTAAECLKVYKRSFGEDNFFHSCNIAITPVTAIYILSEAEKIPDLTQTISTDFHANLSVKYIHEKNLIEEFLSCLSSIATDYFCFYDSRHHSREKPHCSSAFYDRKISYCQWNYPWA